MSYRNVPDDWGCYFTRCSICGTRYHMSEGGCGCTDDKVECRLCGEWVNEDEAHSHVQTVNRNRRKVTETVYTCDDCLECEGCGTTEGLSYDPEVGVWCCPACRILWIAEDAADALEADPSISESRQF